MSVLHEMLETGRRRAREKGAMSVSAAAMALGISPNTLRYRMQRHGMTLEDAVLYYQVKQEEQARTLRAVDEIVGIIMEE